MGNTLFPWLHCDRSRKAIETECWHLTMTFSQDFIIYYSANLSARMNLYTPAVHTFTARCKGAMHLCGLFVKSQSLSTRVNLATSTHTRCLQLGRTWSYSHIGLIKLFNLLIGADFWFSDTNIWSNSIRTNGMCHFISMCTKSRCNN